MTPTLGASTATRRAKIWLERRNAKNPGEAMANRWSGVTIDCADPIRMAAFWAALLGIPTSNEHADDPNWATVGSRSGRVPRLTFQRVPEPKATKVRIHLDVEVDDIAESLDQVETLGGQWSGIRHDYDEGAVLIVHDPEGHEFCLVQYFDHPASEGEQQAVIR